MGLVSRDSPVMLEYAQSLILMKKSLIIMHTCFGDDRKTEKERKKERKGKKKVLSTVTSISLLITVLYHAV